MKKIVLGSMMFLAGVLSTAIILAGSMANDWTINGQHSAFGIFLDMVLCLQSISF